MSPHPDQTAWPARDRGRRLRAHAARRAARRAMRRTARPSLWRDADFMRLWTAESVSRIGSQVSLLALPLAAITVLHASTVQVGLLSTVEFAPFVLVGLPAGVWVDRLRRRPVLIAGDLGRALALASIPLAYALDLLSIGQLYAVGFVTGVLTVFFDVAYQSYLPSLVRPEQLVEGNAKLEISNSGASIAGPGLAGGLIQLVGPAIAVLGDAASFLVSALFVGLIRNREPAPAARAGPAPRPADGRGGMRHEIAAGLRYVLGHRLLRWVAVTTATSNLFYSMISAILVLYMVRQLHLSPGLIGLILTTGNLGWLAGALLAGRLGGRLGIGRVTVAAIALCGPGALLIPLAPQAAPIPLLIASQFLVSFGSTTYNIGQVSLRQAITPASMHGRMNATMRFMVWGTLPVGAALGGTLGGAIGLRPTIWIAAVASLLPLLPALCSSAWTIPSIEAAVARFTPPPPPLEETEPATAERAGVPVSTL
jgi:MFS family permease